MKFTKIVQSTAHLLYAKIIQKRFPFHVSIRLTDACNQNCSYCLGDFYRRGTSSPTTEQINTLVDQFSSLGTRHITLVGGEPLLRDDIENIVKHIKKHAIHCSLTTNGRLVDQKLDMLKHLDLLSISLDGNKDAHDSYRGQGSHAAAIHALDIAQQINLPVLLICTITNKTDFKLRYLTEIAEKYDCLFTFEVLNPLFHKKNTGTLRKEDLGETKTKQLLEYWIKNNNSRLLISSSVLKYVKNWPFDYQTFRIFKKNFLNDFNPIQCYAGIYSVFVEATGDLVPCCLLRNDYKPTNAFDKGVKNAWEEMPSNKCVTCRSIGCNMQNSFFALDRYTLFNFFSTIRKNNFKK